MVMRASPAGERTMRGYSRPTPWPTSRSTSRYCMADIPFPYANNWSICLKASLKRYAPSQQTSRSSLAPFKKKNQWRQRFSTERQYRCSRLKCQFLSAELPGLQRGIPCLLTACYLDYMKADRRGKGEASLPCTRLDLQPRASGLSSDSCWRSSSTSPRSRCRRLRRSGGERG